MLVLKDFVFRYVVDEFCKGLDIFVEVLEWEGVCIIFVYLGGVLMEIY